MITGSEATHGGFDHIRRCWDRASGDDHALWITGSSSPEHYDRSGWQDVLRLIERCPDYRRQLVLEWGCGSGRVTQYLCYLFREIHAVDIAPGMLNSLRERRLPNLTIWHTRGADIDSSPASMSSTPTTAGCTTGSGISRRCCGSVTPRSCRGADSCSSYPSMISPESLNLTSTWPAGPPRSSGRWLSSR